MRRLLVALGFFALLGACWRGTLPPRELYRLTMPSPAVDAASTALDGGAVLRGDLAIAPVSAPGMYGEENIVYRIGEVEYGQYPSRLWALPLGHMLGIMAEAELRRRPLTVGRTVYDPPARHRYDYRWQLTVREFEEVNRGDTVLASVRLDARLVDSRTDSILWAGSAKLERPVQPPTMPAIVATLSEVGAEVIRELIEQSRVMLRGSVVVTPSPRP